MEKGLSCRLVAVSLLVSAVGGCNAKLTVDRYPDFYDPELKSVAVVPFANLTQEPQAGTFLAERLAEALRANGTYQAVGPAELNSMLAKVNLALPADADVRTIASALRELGGFQAFVTGTVKGFSTGRGVQTVIDDYHGPRYYGWGYGRHRHAYGGYGYVQQYYVTEAYVAAAAGMVRVSDATTIHATPSTLAARLRRRDSGPETAAELLTEAADAVAVGLVEAFAVTPRELKISKGKTLRTARPKGDGELKYTNDFRPDDETMLVVLSLPREADRNTFRLVIAREDRPEPLAEETFQWSAGAGDLVFTFAPQELAQAAGLGDYEARLYDRRGLVLKRDFEIED